MDLRTTCGIAKNHNGIFRPMISEIKKNTMVPKTPEIAKSEVTHDRSSISKAPPTNGDFSSDSRINKLELVHPAEYPYKILMRFTEINDEKKINKKSQNN